MALARLFPSLAIALLVLTAAAAAAFVFGPARAQSGPGGWSVCNQTSYVIEAATGRPEGKSVLVSGWLRLRPGECRLAANAPLTRGVHYLFARTSSAHRGGRRQWGGASRLCVDPANSFAIENPPNCQTMGLEQRTFRDVRINKRDSWRTSLAEAEPYSLATARSAGLQRLLADAGYDPATPAGRYDPRRMATAIAQFRAASGLSQSAREEQLIDALEAAARRRADSVGLTLCNRTASKLWSAIARRRGEGWESRGWWQLGPGGCARTIDDPLIQNVYFVEAVLESPQGERLLAAGGESFCTSPSKFAILGREKCDDRMYDTGLFTPISPQGREGMVVEFFERDFLSPGAKPRKLDLPKMADADIVAPQTGRAGRAVPASADNPDAGSGD
ncbi:MAG: DUF1036 domain-containing protein [Hyphomonadaceae bacterium]